MRNIFFKAINRIGVSSVLRWSKGESVTVLSLHRVSEERHSFFDPINPQTFEALVEYYCKHYHVTSFKDIAQRSRKPKLILSFDDGYYDFIEYAVPVLKKYGLPSNHNLVNACLNNNAVIWTQKLNDIFIHLKNNNITENRLIEKTGIKYNHNWTQYYLSFFHKLLTLPTAEKDQILEQLATEYNVRPVYRMMNWEDAKNCIEKYDVEIGCHTYHHPSLFSITTQQELEMEIGNSINELEDKLAVKIDILALPNGQFNNNVVAYSKTKAIKYLLLSDDKANPVKNLNNDFNLISRINMVNENIDEAILRTELFHPKIRKII